MASPPQSRYKLPQVEDTLNKFLKFIYYYRLLFVVIALALISYIDYKVWINYAKDDQLKNAALVLTCGSIIIGIFYSIINYEHNQLKFKHEIKASRDLLTFSTACKMHENELMCNFRNVREMYALNEDYFFQSKWQDVEKLWKESPDTRTSFVIVFNYFEAISLGIEKEIMDEEFMKGFFKTIFREYSSKYGTYLEYIRNKEKNERIFQHFTKLVIKWNVD